MFSVWLFSSLGVSAEISDLPWHLFSPVASLSPRPPITTFFSALFIIYNYHGLHLYYVYFSLEYEVPEGRDLAGLVQVCVPSTEHNTQ